MMKLYLKVSTKGLHSFGMDIIWDNALFDFVQHEDLGVFDQLNCALANGGQGKLILGAANLSQRHISGEHEFVGMEFAWAEGATEEIVQFAVDNVSAKDMDGNDVPFKVLVKNYEPVGHTVIEFVWR